MRASSAAPRKIAFKLALLAGLPLLSAVLATGPMQRSLSHGQALLVALGLSSALLAVSIGRSIVGNTLSMMRVANRVRQEQDFSLRAVKTSHDEFGAWTDAFNDMLSGIDEQTQELRRNRENLEQAIAARTYALWTRTEQMRLVLDTVEAGLATLDQRGRICAERSRAFDAFFGANGTGQPYFQFIAGADHGLSLALELDWWQITDGSMPLEVALAQAKDRIQIRENQFSISYKLILSDGKVKGALLTIENVTDELETRRAEAVQREQATIFARIMQDRAAFLLFFREAQRIVERLRERRFASEEEKLRAVHTLKGNAAQSGVSSVADYAHALEQALLDGEPGGEAAATLTLAAAWQAFVERVLPVLGGDLGERYELSGTDMDELRRALREGRIDDAERRLAHVRGDTIGKHFGLVVAQLQSVSKRLGKATPEIVVSGTEICLPRARFAPFLSALTHVINNVADHGLESERERLSAGKSPQNRVTLSARLENDQVVIEVSDDGRGIDWHKVAERARERSWPHHTRAQLVDALFAIGFSTAETTSEVSGRGVGMSAVLEACRQLDGACTIDSAGPGTRFTATFPLSSAQSSVPAAPAITLERVTSLESAFLQRE